jgi:hypothetical protein
MKIKEYAVVAIATGDYRLGFVIWPLAYATRSNAHIKYFGTKECCSSEQLRLEQEYNS